VKNKRGLQGARRIFRAQIVFNYTLSLGVWLCSDAISASSFVLGGLVWLLPQACFAMLVFSEQRARFSKAIVARVYRAEALKLLLTALFFAVIFRWEHVVPGMLFAGYCLAQALFWFAPLFFRDAMSKARLKAL
jgi:ATP synthase protein I